MEKSKLFRIDLKIREVFSYELLRLWGYKKGDFRLILYSERPPTHPPHQKLFFDLGWPNLVPNT